MVLVQAAALETSALAARQQTGNDPEHAAGPVVRIVGFCWSRRPMEATGRSTDQISDHTANTNLKLSQTFLLIRSVTRQP